MKSKNKRTKLKEAVITTKSKDGTIQRLRTGLTKDELHECLRLAAEELETTEKVKRKLIGIGDNLKTVCEGIYRASQNDNSVLVLGETGTGKEIIARQIHRNSRRSGKKLVVLQPAGLPVNLVDAQLFGSVKGAFTDAIDRPGSIEEAHEGSLFIDEIGDLPPAVQAKLLRVLQFKTYSRLGETKERKSEFRLICASNRPLEQRTDTFRPDLYYRIAQEPIEIRPLRERREDILPIFLYLFKECYPKVAPRKLIMSWNNLYCLIMSNWLGNVREVENRIKRRFVRDRKLAKKIVYHLFSFDELIRKLADFRNDEYDISHPAVLGWGDETVSLVKLAKKLEERYSAPKRGLTGFDIEGALVDEGRRLEGSPKYKQQREEYQKKRNLERLDKALEGFAEKLQKRVPPWWEALKAPHSRETMLSALRSPEGAKQSPSYDSLDSLAESGTPLDEVERRYLEKFSTYHPIEKGKRGKSLLNRANMLGVKSDVLKRKMKRYSLSSNPKEAK